MNHLRVPVFLTTSHRNVNHCKTTLPKARRIPNQNGNWNLLLGNQEIKKPGRKGMDAFLFLIS